MGRVIDAWGTRETLTAIRQRFGYAFDLLPEDAEMYRPQLRAHEIDGPFTLAGIEVAPIDQDHYVCRTTGFRLGAFAYSTDVVTLADRAFAMLDGVDTGVVGCLREAPHPWNAHLPRVLEWGDRLQARKNVV